MSSASRWHKTVGSRLAPLFIVFDKDTGYLLAAFRTLREADTFMRQRTVPSYLKVR